jgi:hypothetical protein
MISTKVAAAAHCAHTLQRSGILRNTEGIVYCLYVDLFGKNFGEIRKRIPYLQELGVSVLWLLPILQSRKRSHQCCAARAVFDWQRCSMLDSTFPITIVFVKILEPITNSKNSFANALKPRFRFYSTLQSITLLRNTNGSKVQCNQRRAPTVRTITGVSAPHVQRMLRVRCAEFSGGTGSEFDQARIIFRGIEESNWERTETGFYFHRFFKHQPGHTRTSRPSLQLALTSFRLELRQLARDACDEPSFRLLARVRCLRIQVRFTPAR